MHPQLTLGTAARVLHQLSHDRRTLVIVAVIPLVVIGLTYAIVDGREPLASKLELDLIVLYPVLIMFLLTAVAMVRERISGTLERLMTTPIGKGDVIVGYALAFGLMAAVQGLVASAFCYWVLDMQVAGPVVLVLLSVVVGALLGVAFGLLAAALSRSEFQAVQLFPAMMIPQFLLCGLLGPREAMADWLYTVSAFLPLTYAIEGLQELFVNAEPTPLYWRDLGITAACVLGLLAAAALTLRRRTP